MAKFVTVLLLLAMMLNSKTHFAKSQSKCSFHRSSERGIELYGFVFKSFQSTELRECFSKCLEHSVCQSINYNIQLFLCQFNTELKRRKPENVRPKYLGVYMENPKRAKRGSHPLLAGHSCKEIKDLGESRGDREYWVDPGNHGTPFTVYCDMTTDSGGWTLIKQSKLNTTNPNQYGRIDVDNYRAVTNCKDIRQNIVTPAIQNLRSILGFHQIRYRCYKKTIGRTLHIKTTNNTAGRKVLDHYLIKASWPTACGSFERLPDDTSILGSNCIKWGYNDTRAEVNQWGRSSNTGTRRIYSNAIVWESKHYLTFFSGGPYYCDDYKIPSYGALSVGDIWELYVR